MVTRKVNWRLKMSDIIINRLNVDSIFGLDIADLLSPNNVDDFNCSRGTESWFINIIDAMSKVEKYGFKYPKIASSLYSTTDRGFRSTFSDYYVDKLMPLVFDLKSPNTFHKTDFSMYIKCISLSCKGAISIRVSIRLDKENKYTIKDIISNYYDIITFLKEKVYNCLISFIKLLNENLNWNLEEISFNVFLHKLLYYEIIDFDFAIKNIANPVIKDLYNDEEYLKQFAVFSRMSKVDYKNYDINKLDKFKHSDLGNRNDEMWVLNSERLIRYHPESTTDKYNMLFFQDVILGAEILLQQKIVLQYLNRWITEKRLILRNNINLIEKKIEINYEEINSMIFKLGNIYDLLSDNFLIQRNIGHSFFNVLIENIIEKMRVKEILNSNKESLSEFFSLITAITSQLMTNQSAKLDSLNYQTSKESANINKLVGRLTFLMFFVAVLQLLVAIFSALKLF